MKVKKLLLVSMLFLAISLVVSGCSPVNENPPAEPSETITVEPTASPEIKTRIVYLTFDDGPSEYTAQILDILDKNNVKATFFVTADHENCLPMIKEEAEKGHKIGIHAYLHKNVLKKVYNSYLLAFDRMDQIIYEQTGEYTDIFRFPGGSSNTLTSSETMEELIATLTERGYKYYDWDVDSMDSTDNATKELVLSTMKESVMESKEYSMILCHDVYEHTVQAIDEFIPWALDNNFEFKIIDENAPEVHHKLHAED